MEGNFPPYISKSVSSGLFTDSLEKLPMSVPKCKTITEFGGCVAGKHRIRLSLVVSGLSRCPRRA